MSSQNLAPVSGKSKAWTGSVVLSYLGRIEPSPALYQTSGELGVASKDFVVSNQIAYLDLMNVWKESLVSVGQQG